MAIVPKVDPVYNQFISNEAISKIKIGMVDAMARSIPPPLGLDDKKYLISLFMNRLNLSIKEAVASSKTCIYLFGSHIPYNVLDKYKMSKDELFTSISDDLFLILKEIGLNPVMIADKTLISLEIDDLKKFCNFEKLIALK